MGKLRLVLFIQNVLIIQLNCTKITCCGKIEWIHKFVKIALHNFAIFWRNYPHDLWLETLTVWSTLTETEIEISRQRENFESVNDNWNWNWQILQNCNKTEMKTMKAISEKLWIRYV